MLFRVSVSKVATIALFLSATLIASDDDAGFKRFQAQAKRFWRSNYMEGDTEWRQKTYEAMRKSKNIDMAAVVTCVDGNKDEDVESTISIQFKWRSKVFDWFAGYARYGKFSKEELAKDFGYDKKSFFGFGKLRDPKTGDIWRLSKNIICGYKETLLYFKDEDVLKQSGNVICRSDTPILFGVMNRTLEDEFKQFKQDQNIK